MTSPMLTEASEIATEHPPVLTPKPKKGKPPPKQPLREFLKKHERYRIVLTGPDYSGTTTILRKLENKGYSVQAAPVKPPVRNVFSEDYFSALIEFWESLHAND